MSVLRIAFDALFAVTADGAYTNIAINECIKNYKKPLTQSEKGFISACVYTAVENLYYIDMCIDRFCSSKPKPKIKNLLRLGVAQLLYMKKPASAVCNECVSLCSEIGKAPLKGFCNGVLRSISLANEQNTLPEITGDIAERLHIKYCFPKWLVKEYLDRFGEAASEKIFSFSDSRVRVRAQYPFTHSELLAYLEENGIEYEKSKVSSETVILSRGRNIVENELFSDGKITVQSEGSSYVCQLVDPKRGQKILDACAAPGGKTANIASRTENSCEITATELYEHRTELIINTLKRLKVSCAEVKCTDAAAFCKDYLEVFDTVLVDAPCSGFGVLGKPDIRIKQNKEAKDIENLSAIQLAILNNCAKYLKKGGSLVYSTCTVTKTENESVINAFLAENKAFEIVPIGDMGSDFVYLMPHTHSTGSFFIAKLKRNI